MSDQQPFSEDVAPSILPKVLLVTVVLAVLSFLLAPLLVGGLTAYSSVQSFWDNLRSIARLFTFCH